MAGCENHFQAINARQGFGQCLLPHQRRQGWAATSLSCLSMLHQTIPCDRQTFISKTPQQYPSYYYMYAFLLPLQVIHLKEGHRNRQNKLWPVPSPAQHLEQVKTSSMYAPHPHTERFTQPSSPYWTPSSPPKQTPGHNIACATMPIILHQVRITDARQPKSPRKYGACSIDRKFRDKHLTAQVYSTLHGFFLIPKDLGTSHRI